MARTWLLLLCLSLCGVIAAADDVIVLTSTNFTSFTSQKLTIVEFYAPWCGHCKSLEPEYAAAAKELKKIGVPLVKVDGTAESALTAQFKVNGFPTMFVFRHGYAFEFRGGRTKDTIVEYVTNEASPIVTSMPSADAVRVLASRLARPLVVLAGVNNTAPVKRGFAQVGDVFRERMSFVTLEDGQPLGIANGSVAVFPSFELLGADEATHHDIDLTTIEPSKMRDTVGKFVQNSAWAVIDEIEPGNTMTVYRASPNGAVCIVFYPGDIDGLTARRALADLLRPVAIEFQENVRMVLANLTTFEHDAWRWAISVNDSMTAVIDHPAELKKYRMPGAVTPASLTKFIKEFKFGALKHYIKSQPDPGPVRMGLQEVVGTTFEKIVRDAKKDVLLMTYSMKKCDACTTLFPVYAEVAAKFKDSKTLVVARIDALNNDLPVEYETDMVPLFFFKPASTASTGSAPLKPVRFDASDPEEKEKKRKPDVTVANLVSFVHKHATLTRPEPVKTAKPKPQRPGKRQDL